MSTYFCVLGEWKISKGLPKLLFCRFCFDQRLSLWLGGGNKGQAALEHCWLWRSTKDPPQPLSHYCCLHHYLEGTTREDNPPPPTHTPSPPPSTQQNRCLKQGKPPLTTAPTCIILPSSLFSVSYRGLLFPWCAYKLSVSLVTIEAKLIFSWAYTEAGSKIRAIWWQWGWGGRVGVGCGLTSTATVCSRSGYFKLKDLVG